MAEVELTVKMSKKKLVKKIPQLRMIEPGSMSFELNGNINRVPVKLLLTVSLVE